MLAVDVNRANERRTYVEPIPPDSTDVKNAQNIEGGAEAISSGRRRYSSPVAVRVAVKLELCAQAVLQPALV